MRLKGGLNKLRMKKLLSLMLVMSFLVCVSGVVAIDTTIELSDRGDGVSEWSSLHVTSGDYSTYLYAPLITVPGGPSENYHEARIRIIPTTPLDLSAFNTMSWEQYVNAGYMAHVDVFLDNGKTLIFEGAKSTDGVYCDSSDPYPTGELTTFGVDRGEQINVDTYAWENGPIPGPCGDPDFEEIHNTLGEWKVAEGYAGAKITAFEIEVDGWIPTIAESEVYIDEVMINGEEVVIEYSDSGSQDLGADLDDVVSISVTPPTISFGNIPRGVGITKSGDAITINGSDSDTESGEVYVYVDVTGTDEGFYETLLELELPILGFTNILGVGALEIPDNESVVYNTQLHGDTTSYTSGPKQATIVYTAYGTPLS